MKESTTKRKSNKTIITFIEIAINTILLIAICIAAVKITGTLLSLIPIAVLGFIFWSVILIGISISCKGINATIEMNHRI